jgi:4-amino-4-deoxy-L-arabinose transferase-like glycosyltransferase
VTPTRPRPPHIRERASGIFARRRTHLALALILVVAFALRAAVYLENPHPVEIGGLAAEQAEMARNIVDHGEWFVANPEAYLLVKNRQVKEERLIDFSQVDFSRVDRRSGTEPVADQMPGVAVLLTGLWWLTGHETYALLQWLQILVDTGLVLLIYWIAIRLSRAPRVAIIAAALYALWPGSLVMDTRPVPDAWAVFFTIGCVGAFVWARDRPESRRRLALLGLITGVGIYFRPFVFLLPIALGLAATPGGGWRRRVLWISAPAVVALLVLAPWTIRNYYEFDHFIPTRTGLGQAIFEGTGQAFKDEDAQQYVHQKHGKVRYGTPSYDDFLLNGAARAIADDPGKFVRLMAHRARFLVPCLLVLLAWRRFRSAALIPLAAAVATIVPYLPIGDETRFYLPAVFAYLILIGMSADVVLRTLRSTLVSARPRPGPLPSVSEQGRG